MFLIIYHMNLRGVSFVFVLSQAGAHDVFQAAIFFF
jgi:hypothetical protein